MAHAVLARKQARFVRSAQVSSAIALCVLLPACLDWAHQWPDQKDGGAMIDGDAAELSDVWPDGPQSCAHPNVTAKCVDGWCTIPSGCFTMGAPPDEMCGEESDVSEPHQVTLTHAFIIGQSEVTQGQFELRMGDNPSGRDDSHACREANCPVDSVGRSSAMAYCNDLSDTEGRTPCYACIDQSCQVVDDFSRGQIYDCPGYRLPTEAEWEYACRAGTSTPFYIPLVKEQGFLDCTATLEKIAWFEANSGWRPHLVEIKPANAWGLHDMLGNVNEWVHDNYQEDLGSDPVTDPWGAPEPHPYDLLRGGSFFQRPHQVRSASRFNNASNSGFRCVRTLK